jgi:hypothetical protein
MATVKPLLPHPDRGPRATGVASIAGECNPPASPSHSSAQAMASTAVLAPATTRRSPGSRPHRAPRRPHAPAEVGAPAPLGMMLVLGVFVDFHRPHPSPGGTPTIVCDPPNGPSGQSSQRGRPPGRASLLGSVVCLVSCRLRAERAGLPVIPHGGKAHPKRVMTATGLLRRYGRHGRPAPEVAGIGGIG